MLLLITSLDGWTVFERAGLSAGVDAYLFYVATSIVIPLYKYQVHSVARPVPDDGPLVPKPVELFAVFKLLSGPCLVHSLFIYNSWYTVYNIVS